LLVVHPTETLVLIVDHYSSHTVGIVKEWVATQSCLRLLYLPTCCSHLNPVGHIWLWMKNKIAANRRYGSTKPLLDAVAAFFTEMSPEQALERAAA